MKITFIYKGGTSSYKTLGKDCQRAGIGQEMEQLHLHNVSLKSEKDVKNLMRVLEVVQCGFGEFNHSNFTPEEFKELIRRTD